MNSSQKKKYILGIILLLILIGGIVHILNPSEIYAGKNQLNENEYIIIPITQDEILAPVGYEINIRVSGRFS